MGKTDYAKAAARAHSDLNVFASIATILEGGHIYRPSTQIAVEEIIAQCKDEQQEALREYDSALAAMMKEDHTDETH